MTTSLETIEAQTGAKPDAAVIWLHGLGADGHDFEPVVPALNLRRGLAVRFIFPHAPEQPVSINMGMHMRAWYDIYQFGGGREDEAGIRASEKLLAGLIDKEKVRGIAEARIVLAGFSQGGAIALQTALRYPARLAGVLALSTYLPLAGMLAAERNVAGAATPIFMAHGQQDELIGIDRARRSREFLEALGCAIEWHEYPMGHAVCPEEIAAIAAWLGRVL
jgi:phospholipase/carboxylesterase